MYHHAQDPSPIRTSPYRISILSFRLIQINQNFVSPKILILSSLLWLIGQHFCINIKNKKDFGYLKKKQNSQTGL
jgi:hypothetical protein